MQVKAKSNQTLFVGGILRELFTTYEITPLSTSQLDALVTQALYQCEEFRTTRSVNIDRFAVVDIRTPEQIEVSLP